jgi:hypothetical protein
LTGSHTISDYQHTANNRNDPVPYSWQTSGPITLAGDSFTPDFERSEPRCRICRDETVRVLVNKLLDWHGAPIILGRGKTHVVTYADILRDLEPLNDGRDKRDRITYDSLWVHAKRHYDHAGVTAYWTARMHKELMNALRG